MCVGLQRKWSFRRPARPVVSWTLPKENIIKINVDGSFSPSSGASGIGGYHHGLFLIDFAKHVEADSTIHAKILAIREEMLVTAVFGWFGSTIFAFESNSTNVVSWFFRFVRCVLEILEHYQGDLAVVRTTSFLVINPHPSFGK